MNAKIGTALLLICVFTIGVFCGVYKTTENCDSHSELIDMCLGNLTLCNDGLTVCNDVLVDLVDEMNENPYKALTWQCLEQLQECRGC